MRGAIREEIASIKLFDALENVHRTDALAWIHSGAQVSIRRRASFQERSAS
jgi:hypothetical protein